MSGTTETPIPLLPEPDHEVESGRKIKPVGSTSAEVEAKSILTAPIHKIDESISNLIKRRTDKLFDDIDHKLAGDEPIGSHLPDMHNANSAEFYNSDSDSFFEDIKLIISELTPPIVCNIFDALARRNASASDEHSAFRRVLNATVPARLRNLILKLITTTTIYDLEVDKKSVTEGKTESAYTGSTTIGKSSVSGTDLDSALPAQPSVHEEAITVPKKTGPTSAPAPAPAAPQRR